jgi:addiction module HigA family antidote
MRTKRKKPETVVLKGPDRDVFLKAVAQPPAPTPRLIDALRRHRAEANRVSEKSPWKDEAEMLKAINYAEATHRLSGFPPMTPEERKLLLQDARGEISEAEFNKRATALAKKMAREGRVAPDKNPTIPLCRLPSSPGEILREDFMKPRRLPRATLAKRLGMPEQDLVEILRGWRPVTAPNARQLAREFGTSAELWLNLQRARDAAIDHRMATCDAALARIHREITDPNVRALHRLGLARLVTNEQLAAMLRRSGRALALAIERKKARSSAFAAGFDAAVRRERALRKKAPTRGSQR